jgi:23S rRNA pseudouridine1911/1915/1917 synthase
MPLYRQTFKTAGHLRQGLLILDILLDDNHCLVVNKPAGLLVEHDENHPAQKGLDSALAQARTWIKEKYQKPGRAFLQPVHRIDQPVSGVVLFARTSKAASRLVEAFRSRKIDKFYLVAVEGELPKERTKLNHHVRESARQGVMEVIAKPDANSKPCSLELQVVTGNVALIKLGTGRKHQIRVQLAAIGCPVAGDKKYGATSNFDSGNAIALHAFRLRFPHPTRDELVDVVAPLPANWRQLINSMPTQPTPNEVHNLATIVSTSWDSLA